MVSLPRGFGAAAMSLLALFCSSCSPLATQVRATYEVTFEADGQEYRVGTTYTCFDRWDFEQGDVWTSVGDLSIRGKLADGSPYVVKALEGPSCATPGDEGSRSTTKELHSRIYVQIPGRDVATVESFDDQHVRSAHHGIAIRKSSRTFASEGRILAGRVKHQPESLVGDVYVSVGVKVTPFTDAAEAKRDFYSSDCLSFQQTPGPPCQDPKFKFHPLDAHIQNSEGRATYQGDSFDVVLGAPEDAPTWIVNHDVRLARGQSFFVLRHDSIHVTFHGQSAGTMDPLLGRTFFQDPESGRVLIFFVDNAILDF